MFESAHAHFEITVHHGRALVYSTLQLERAAPNQRVLGQAISNNRANTSVLNMVSALLELVENINNE